MINYIYIRRVSLSRFAADLFTMASRASGKAPNIRGCSLGSYPRSQPETPLSLVRANSFGSGVGVQLGSSAQFCSLLVGS